MKKIIINWLIYEKGWAFQNLTKHIRERLPCYKHEEAIDISDVEIQMTPSGFKRQKPSSKTILHLDSNRWYDHF